MFLIVDLVIIVFILLFAFLGYKKGFVKIALGLCTFIIATIVAFLLYRPVANIVIDTTEIDESIEQSIIAKVLPEGVPDDTEVDTSDISKTLPSFVLKNSNNTVKSIAESMSRALIEIGCLLLIYIVVKIVLRLIIVVVDLIAKLPVLKQFNEFGGLVFGIIEGFIFVFTILAFVSLLLPLLNNSEQILSAIDGSIIGSIMFNNNILLKLIM